MRESSPRPVVVPVHETLRRITRLEAAALALFVALCLVLPTLVPPLAAQAARATARPAELKGILEPVSYSEDIELEDVFFVNVDVGWASGAHGTILHTTDGGNTWDAQLGGDPAARTEPIRKLHFLDERHGWAVWRTKLLRTTGGESWEEVGSIPMSVRDIAFVSPLVGFMAADDNRAVGATGGAIYRTTDGGRTWKLEWACSARAQMGGLNRNVVCRVNQLQFPSPMVGYGVAGNTCVGMGCDGPPLLAKTEDGGATWRTLIGPGDPERDRVRSLFFLDEQTGYVLLASGKLNVTSDGGESWRGVVAAPGRQIRFADPSVGWALEPGTSVKLAFTTDGGARWGSRDLRFPAQVRAYSMPRRDRAYIVGNHGMIYRYRVVPVAHTGGRNNIAAPAMPGFDSPLDEQVEQLEQVVSELGQSLDSARAPAGDDTGSAAAPASAAGDEAAAELPLDAPLPPPSAFTRSCCSRSFSRLEAVLGALSQSLPQFTGRYRNLNLLVAGIRMGAELPAQARTVKGGIGAFRQAQDKESAQAALAGVLTSLATFRQTTLVSMQQQLPPQE